jgi:crotonobetainyl-CoA:carnitine CoA-transferase CaiB-like acyl-CoA transferase
MALSHIRICDFTGQLAGAGATKWMSAFGADVIRVEDPVRQGTWDILRMMMPFVDDRRGVDFGGGFNNHNTEKHGITLNLRTERGKQLLTQIIEQSDVVAENFAYGVFEKWGFGYEQLREIKPDIIYVSNCGFGHTGPYKKYKTWGPIVQAMSGLTFTSGLPDMEPAGWGYSYMDHTGAYYMAIAIMMALLHKQRTGEGQWVDMSCTEAGTTLNGPALLDYTVNGRRMRREGSPNSTRSNFPGMAPHGIFACDGDDEWIAISVRDDADWKAFAGVVGVAGVAGEEWTRAERFATTEARLAAEDELEALVSQWTKGQSKFATEQKLQAAGVPAAAVQKPHERIDNDPETERFGLWPTAEHSKMGEVRVDGIPANFSKTPWNIERGGPCLGEHNHEVLSRLLGLSGEEIDDLREEGVI